MEKNVIALTLGVGLGNGRFGRRRSNVPFADLAGSYSLDDAAGRKSVHGLRRPKLSNGEIKTVRIFSSRSRLQGRRNVAPAAKTGERYAHVSPAFTSH